MRFLLLLLVVVIFVCQIGIDARKTPEVNVTVITVAVDCTDPAGNCTAAKLPNFRGMETTQMPPPMPASPHWTMPWGQYVVIGISYPSMVLYFTLIAKIVMKRWKSNQFSSAFFDLVLVEFFNDAIFFFFMQFGLRFPRYYILPFYGEIGGTIAYAMFLTFRAVLYLGHIPFALNRLTLYLKPHQYERIWTKRTVFFCFCLQWGAPLVVNVPFFITTARAINTRFPMVVLMLASPEALTLSLIETTTFVVCSTVICSIAFGYCLVLSSKNVKISRVEHRLLKSSILQALPMFLELFRILVHFTLVVILDRQSAVAIVSEVAYYYLDLTCTIQPWCLLATNSNIRQLFLPSNNGKADHSNSVISVTTIPIKH